MRNSIVSSIAVAIAVAALFFCVVQHQQIMALESAQKAELASTKAQETERLRRTDKLVDATNELTALLARIVVSQEDKIKADAELVKRVGDLDKRTLMSGETIKLAQKNAQDLRKLTESLQETFNAVGTSIGELKAELKLQRAVKGTKEIEGK